MNTNVITLRSNQCMSHSNEKLYWKKNQHTPLSSTLARPVTYGEVDNLPAVSPVRSRSARLMSSYSHHTDHIVIANSHDRHDPVPRLAPFSGRVATAIEGQGTTTAHQLRPILQLNVEGFTAAKKQVVEQLARNNKGLRPTPVDQLPVLAEIAPPALRREAATLVLGRRACQHDHLLRTRCNGKFHPPKETEVTSPSHPPCSTTGVLCLSTRDQSVRLRVVCCRRVGGCSQQRCSFRPEL